MIYFRHPVTKAVYALQDTAKYFCVYSDFPMFAGQKIEVENYRLINGKWQPNGESVFVVDEEDLKSEYATQK